MSHLLFGPRILCNKDPLGTPTQTSKDLYKSVEAIWRLAKATAMVYSLNLVEQHTKVFLRTFDDVSSLEPVGLRIFQLTGGWSKIEVRTESLDKDFKLPLSQEEWLTHKKFLIEQTAGVAAAFLINELTNQGLTAKPPIQNFVLDTDFLEQPEVNLFTAQSMLNAIHTEQAQQKHCIAFIKSFAAARDL